jgi:hypothetical protein
MRTIQLLTLALLVTAANADNISSVSVTAGVFKDPFIPNPPTVPGCGGTKQGVFSASISFSCEMLYSGSAAAETEVGPFGIGGGFGLSAFGSSPELEAASSASFSWSQDVVIRGAQGSGFATGTISGLSTLGDDFWAAFSLTLFDQPILAVSNTFTIPVTFGVPYTLTMSGRSEVCTARDPSFGCGGSPEIFVDSLSFLDANGNPLPNAMLVDVPESSSWLLLATCALPIIIWRLMRRGTPERTVYRVSGFWPGVWHSFVFKFAAHRSPNATFVGLAPRN